MRYLQKMPARGQPNPEKVLHDKWSQKKGKDHGREKYGHKRAKTYLHPRHYFMPDIMGWRVGDTPVEH